MRNISIYFFVGIFAIFLIISPWNRAWPILELNFKPLNHGCFVASLVEISQVFLEKKLKIWNVYICQTNLNHIRIHKPLAQVAGHNIIWSSFIKVINTYKIIAYTTFYNLQYCVLNIINYLTHLIKRPLCSFYFTLMVINASKRASIAMDSFVDISLIISFQKV